MNLKDFEMIFSLTECDFPLYDDRDILTNAKYVWPKRWKHLYERILDVFKHELAHDNLKNQSKSETVNVSVDLDIDSFKKFCQIVNETLSEKKTSDKSLKISISNLIDHKPVFTIFNEDDCLTMTDIDINYCDDDNLTFTLYPSAVLDVDDEDESVERAFVTDRSSMHGGRIGIIVGTTDANEYIDEEIYTIKFDNGDLGVFKESQIERLKSEDKTKKEIQEEEFEELVHKVVDEITVDDFDSSAEMWNRRWNLLIKEIRKTINERKSEDN